MKKSTASQNKPAIQEAVHKLQSYLRSPRQSASDRHDPRVQQTEEMEEESTGNQNQKSKDLLPIQAQVPPEPRHTDGGHTEFSLTRLDEHNARSKDNR